jgi:hypothetical protein
MGGYPLKEFKIAGRFPADARIDKAVQIIIMSGHSRLSFLFRRSEGLFMKQHGLFPESAFRRYRSNRKIRLCKQIGEGIHEIGMDIDIQSCLCIGTGAQLNLDHLTQISRSIAKGCRVGKKKCLLIRIIGIQIQLPR